MSEDMRVLLVGVSLLCLSWAGCTPASKSGSPARPAESVSIDPPAPSQPGSAAQVPGAPALAAANRCWDSAGVRTVTLETLEHGVPVKRSFDLDTRRLSGSKGTPQGDTAPVDRIATVSERRGLRDALAKVCLTERTETRNLPASRREHWLFLATDRETLLVSREKAVVPPGTHYLVLDDDAFSALLRALPSP